MDQKVSRAIRTARRYADGGDVDERSTFRRALDTGMDYAGRGLALADLYSGGMLSSVAGLVPGNSIANAQAARDRALEGVPREAKALATEPINPVAAIFAGPMARTANRKMLQRAEELAAQNAPREQIWNETGWFKGVDGKWRFEIDDSQAITPFPTQERVTNKGSDSGTAFQAALNHPKVFDAYPDARRMDWVITNSDQRRGGYEPAKGEFPPRIISQGPTTTDRRSALMHELQHRIQDMEGFAVGANPESAYGLIEKPRLDELREKTKALRIDPYRIANKRSGGYPLTPEEVEKYAEWERLQDARDEILSNMVSPYEAYKRHAGETEARLVQKRMDLTTDQRRARAPWLDYDVPEQDQFVRFR